jgi:hypothetical protein
MRRGGAMVSGLNAKMKASTMITKFSSKTVAAGLLLAGSMSVCVQAAPNDFTDGFTVDSVSALLSDLKATDIKSVVVDGDPRLIFKLFNTNITADLYECQGTPANCKILQFMILYDPLPTDTVEAVNDFNRKYLYGKATFDKKEGLLSYRMINGHAGTTKAQVTDEFLHFVGVTDVLLKFMKSNAQVVAQLPGAESSTMLSAPMPSEPLQLNSRIISLPKNSR